MSIEKIFKDQLQHAELPLSPGATFEGAMHLRSKKKPFILKPIIAIGGIAIIAVSTWLMFSKNTGNETNSKITNINNKNQNSVESNIPLPIKSNDAVENRKNVEIHEKNFNPTEVRNVNSIASNQNQVRSATPKGTSQQNNIHSNQNSGSAAIASNVTQNQNWNLLKYASFIGAKKINKQYINYGFSESKVNAKIKARKKPYFEKSNNICFKPFEIELAYVSENKNYVNNITKPLAVNGRMLSSNFYLTANYKKNNLYFGIGLGYGQQFGTANIVINTLQKVLVIDTQKIIIKQPGLPDLIVFKYDSTYQNKNVSAKSDVSYQFSKLQLPVLFKFCTNGSQVKFRASSILAPGIAFAQSGKIFNEKQNPSYLNTKSVASFDAKLAVGLQLNLGQNWEFVAEPNLQFSTLLSKQFVQYNHLNYGFNLGLVYSLNKY